MPFSQCRDTCLILVSAGDSDSGDPLKLRQDGWGAKRGAGQHRKTLVVFYNVSCQRTRGQNRIIGRIAVGVLHQIC